MTAAEYHTIDLGRLNLRSGQGRRIELALAIQPVDQGGNRYEVDGGTVEARIDVSRTATGFALRLRFGARITGPCVRCLEPASIEVEVDAREVDQPRTDDEELRSPYVDEEILDLGAWAHDALLLALPQQLLCRPDCAGLCPVCGESLNDADPADHEHDTGGDPRWAKLRELLD